MSDDQRTAAPDDAFIGVDVGGTHTDVSVVYRGDRVERGKALTTYDDFSRGVLEAVEVAARELRPAAWTSCSASTQLFINGTTVVTNTITQLRGSRVGVLITSGFKDAFRLAGGAAHDGDRRPPPGQRPRPRRPPRDRRDRRADRLVGHGPRPDRPRRRSRPRPRAWSRRSASTRSRSASSGATPTASTSWRRRRRSRSCTPTSSSPRRTASSRSRARRGAGRPRSSTPSSRTRPTSTSTSLNEKLRDAGLDGGLAFFQGLGGGISLEKARQYPLGLLGSGPAGGAIGANELAKRMGTEARAARRHGRHELRHRDHRRQRDPHREEPRARPVPDRRQHRRRDLGRRRRRLDRLGLRARRAAGRPAERRLDARPGGAGPRRRPSRPSPTRW